MVLGMRVKRSMGMESETGHSGMKYTHYLNRDTAVMQSSELREAHLILLCFLTGLTSLTVSLCSNQPARAAIMQNSGAPVTLWPKMISLGNNTNVCLETLLHVSRMVIIQWTGQKHKKVKYRLPWWPSSIAWWQSGLYLYNVGQLATHQPPAALRILTQAFTFQIK